ALPPVTVKGKAEPLPVFQVISARDEPMATEVTGLLGRDVELAALRDALLRATRGEGNAVALIGDAGVGKSRLMSELTLSIAAGIGRLTARCASFDQETPYALLSDLLRAAFRIIPGVDEDVARNAILQGLAAATSAP